MTKDLIKDPLFPDCPVRNILARIGSKWSLLVLYVLSQESRPMRFKDFERAIPDISQKMLSLTLQSLVADGLVSRQCYAEVPPRVEYRITERAQTLLPILRQLIDWAYNNMSDILADRQQGASLS